MTPPDDASPPNRDTEGAQLLTRAAEVVQGELRAARGRHRGLRVTRAALHFRSPQGDFDDLVAVRPPGPADRHDEEGVARLRPSATVWRLLVDGASAVLVDVANRRALALGRDGHIPLPDHDVPMGLTSLVALEEAAADWLLAWPLRDEAGVVVAQACVELRGPAELATSVPLWREVTAQVAPELAQAWPAIAALPAAPPPHDAKLALPVVGATMGPVVGLLRKFSRYADTLLLHGATGVGKTWLARWCHQQSPREPEPFEEVHVQAFPENLIEGELFGWEKGAFTGAVAARTGAIARAGGGTLFIDEVDTLPMQVQSKLLEVLESRTYRRAGSDEVQRCHARIIVGASDRLLDAVREGRFREDLYYRISELPVCVPGLDERRDEIASWARFFCARVHAEETGRRDVVLSDRAIARLQERPWPGNLRQLDRAVRRAWMIAVPVEGADGPVVVDVAHVERALGLDLLAPPAGDRAVQLAAEAVVDAAIRARDAGSAPPGLDLMPGFRGYVLDAAIARLGSADDAFRLFGDDRLVASRNHRAELKKQQDRKEALRRALDP